MKDKLIVYLLGFNPLHMDFPSYLLQLSLSFTLVFSLVTLSELEARIRSQKENCEAVTYEK